MCADRRTKFLDVIIWARAQEAPRAGLSALARLMMPSMRRIAPSSRLCRRSASASRRAGVKILFTMTVRVAGRMVERDEKVGEAIDVQRSLRISPREP